MNRKAASFIIGTFLVALGTPAHAEASSALCSGAAESIPAVVQATTGAVSKANLGNGLVDIKPGASLKVGDKVFAGRSSTVSVYFASAQCSKMIEPNSVLEIGERAPCMPAACEASVRIEPAQAATGCQVGEYLDANGVCRSTVPIALLVGGVAVTGVTAAAIIMTNDDGDGNRRPVTPQ